MPEPNQMLPTSSDRFKVLGDFSVKSLQKLAGIGTKLQQAISIMRLNADVVGRLVAHYESLTEDAEFPEELKSGCLKDMDTFRERAEACLRSLELEQCRINAFLGILEDGKQLFGTILQYRNMEINKLFAVNAQEASSRMEQLTAEMHNSTLRMETLTTDLGRIAEKTERETASMHIITLVTLVFLPGTFMAVRYGLRAGSDIRLLTRSQTLFGSGLFQWNQNDPDMSFPIWKQEYFNLFAEICFPLMASVILIWYVTYKRSVQKRRPDGENKDEEMQDGSYKKE